jgi:hypothetical protein
MATEAERREILNREVTAALQQGGRIESQSDFNAVVLHGKPVNHVLHLILSVLTVGFWLIVWALLVLTNKPQRVVFSVDSDGAVHRTVTT